MLSSNVKVLFKPYKETMFFHKRDRFLIERVLEIVRHKYDSLTSDGLCIKPIYSRPTGYTHESGSKDNLLYTYELASVLSDEKASMPYYLYVNQADGSKLPSAMPILAHRVSIHIYKDVYLQFKPNNISVSEVIDICKLKYKECKPLIENTYWGVDDRQVVQTQKGKARRSLDGIEYRLLDLLAGDAYLPAELIAGKYYLTEPIIIHVAKASHQFDTGTPMTTLWTKWRTLSGDTSCVCDQKYASLCIFDASLLRMSKETLPSIKGLVTSHKVVIRFTDDSVLCYKENTLIQDILWTLHRLYKGNNPTRKNYTFIHRRSKKRVSPTKIYKTIFDLLEDFEDRITENCLILLDPSCMPMPIPQGTTTTEAEAVYIKVVKQLNSKKKADMSQYRIWKNAAR